MTVRPIQTFWRRLLLIVRPIQTFWRRLLLTVRPIQRKETTPKTLTVFGVKAHFFTTAKIQRPIPAGNE